MSPILNICHFVAECKTESSSIFINYIELCNLAIWGIFVSVRNTTNYIVISKYRLDLF